MADIERVLEDLKERVHLRKEGDAYYLISPFFHANESESVPLRFFREGDSLFLSDCGSTFVTMDNRYIDISAVRDRLERAKRRFFLTERERGELVMEFPSDQVISIEMFLGYFIQGISVIANLDISD